MRLLKFMFLFSFTTICFGGSLPPEVLAPLQAAMPEAKFDNYVAGDFNEDGKVDAAVIAYRPSDKMINESIVVLLNSGDSYQIAVHSKEWADHERRADNMSINKGALSLDIEGSSSCCSRYLQEIKFRMRNGIFVLVGEEVYEAGVATDESPEWDTQTSINYLAGKIIYSSHTEGKKRKEHSSRFKEPLLPLSEFSYYTYRDNFHTKELRD